MKRGLVVGKFYPPHAGHHYLIRRALASVDQLYVGVVDNPTQSIPAELRAEWLREIHPEVDVHVIADINDDDNSDAWADYTRQFLGYMPDLVATSEEYGKTWSKALGCEHLLVDIDRMTYPVSGTKVRQDPFACWQFLSAPVRAYYAQRICLLGAESTGTTTLTRALAATYDTTWVPEYGRFYTEGKLTGNKISADWNSHEFRHIAAMQNHVEDELARYSNKLLFCDTNAFATQLWHELYIEQSSAAVSELAKNRYYDLYIVTAPDIPFIQDGMRDAPHRRQWMHDEFVRRLTEHNVPFIVVTGTVDERLQTATAAINKLPAVVQGIHTL